jgi:hypothetical protein
VDEPGANIAIVEAVVAAQTVVTSAIAEVNLKSVVRTRVIPIVRTAMRISVNMPPSI